MVMVDSEQPAQPYSHVSRMCQKSKQAWTMGFREEGITRSGRFFVELLHETPLSV